MWFGAYAEPILLGGGRERTELTEARRAMKTRTKTVISLLLLSAIATPAAANWFARPTLGINLNVGSAPSPSPYDLRMVEGYAILRQSQVITVDMLRDMEGKTVIGENGEMLGTILTVDEGPQLVEVQLPTGVAVAVEARLLVDEPNRVVAPTLSRADMLETARAQTGTTVALNIIHQ